ncbi:hypothetical protein AVEN_79846-1 [Araneus ventricosus]|uniref:Uncharacterized protein n=1 Tax=Araneus ventricosus TaxID=182803 RepID=A0A4Y2PNP2_ARAVE|nr:hypothetical protein AVEN_79846-1 [Araneus ventricosus]
MCLSFSLKPSFSTALKDRSGHSLGPLHHLSTFLYITLRFQQSYAGWLRKVQFLACCLEMLLSHVHSTGSVDVMATGTGRRTVRRCYNVFLNGTNKWARRKEDQFAYFNYFRIKLRMDGLQVLKFVPKSQSKRVPI